MKIIIDASNVNPRGRGLLTYLMGILRGWDQSGLEDELIVVGSASLPAEVDTFKQQWLEVRRIDTGNSAFKVMIQQIHIPKLAQQHNSDVVMSLTPILPLRPLSMPTVATLHDFRFLRRSSEFSMSQRVYRSLMYRHGLMKSTALIANSGQTASDAKQVWRTAESKLRVVYPGADNFPEGTEAVSSREHGIAFAHWTNKRPDFSIQTWAVLKANKANFDYKLFIVGVQPDSRSRLMDLAQSLGVGDLIELLGALPGEEYWRLFSSASVVLMPSTFEGFGFPVVEAMRLRVPVVATNNAGMQEAGGQHAFYAPIDSPSSFAQEVEKALFNHRLRDFQVEEAYKHALRFTWKKTALDTRQVLEEVVASVR